MGSWSFIFDATNCHRLDGWYFNVLPCQACNKLLQSGKSASRGFETDTAHVFGDVSRAIDLGEYQWL